MKTVRITKMSLLEIQQFSSWHLALDRKLNAAIASQRFSFIPHPMALQTTGCFVSDTVALTVTASLTACDGYQSVSRDYTLTVSIYQTKCEINVK